MLVLEHHVARKGIEKYIQSEYIYGLNSPSHPAVFNTSDII